MAEPYALGAPTARLEALAKIRGEERYAADIAETDMLWAVARRAGLPSAVVEGIDSAAAEALPGVVAVLTAADVAGTNLLGLVEPDQPVLVSDRVRFAGDPLCLVLAKTAEAARKGADLVTVRLRQTEAVFDTAAALKAGAPLVHPEGKRGNVIAEGYLRRGDAEALLAGAAHVAEETFFFPAQEHAYLETEAGLARYDGTTLTLEVSTQNPWRDRDELSRALGLPAERIRVIAPSLGGGFGGKDGVVIQGLLGLAALAVPGRSVKMAFSRTESFLCSPKRHGAETTFSVCCDESGRLLALRGRIVLDGGAYASMSLPVLMNALDHCGGCYRFDAVDVTGKAVYTNNPYGGAFRAFGAPQVQGALEQLVDRLAASVGLDPLAFRLKNALRRGDRNSSGVTLTGSVGIVACLERLRKDPLWRDRKDWAKSAPPGRLRATGMAAIVHGLGFGFGVPDFANARIDFVEGGRFRIHSGIVDMGQGNGSTYAQLAGDLLGQGPEVFSVVQPDTELSLRSGPAAASRTTYIFGRALLAAASELKVKMTRKAALVLGCDEGDLALLPGRFRDLPGGRELPLERLVPFMEPQERSCVAGSLAPVADSDAATDYGPRRSGFPHCLFSWGAHLVRVEVTACTGEVAVTDYLAVTEAGRVLNPLCYRQQVEGGVVQGLGYALMEEFLCRDGQVLTGDFSTYLVPMALDVPPIRSVAVELDEPSGPGGLKGVGELPLIGPLPALGNALAALCGRTLTGAPFTAERVLDALKEGGVRP